MSAFTYVATGSFPEDATEHFKIVVVCNSGNYSQK